MGSHAPRTRGASGTQGRAVDDATARGLIALNNRFYAEHAASFSATRTAPWEGWRRLACELRERGWAGSGGDEAGIAPRGPSAPLDDGAPLAAAATDRTHARRSVLDLACGNLRFGRFLAGAFPELDLDLAAVDDCPELAGDARDLPVTFRQLDVLDALLDGRDLAPELGQPLDLTVCFGFMHHVPGAELRRRVLDALVDATAPGGFVALSFWRFMDDGRLAPKAERADGLAAGKAPFSGFSAGALDDGDHFLGWQDEPCPLRYSHHFDEGEVDCWASGAGGRARGGARWSADGRGGTLNRYLLLQRS